MAIEKLENGNYYHIYNHAVGGRNLFDSTDNYKYFLSLYDKYSSPIAETYAWVLMPNHFHVMVRIKENADKQKKIENPSQQFSNLFNAYAQAFNKRYQTWGTLFERPFRRKRIKDEMGLKKLVVYINNNPVHHGFCSYAKEYPWSSYLTCLSEKKTKLQREAVLSWFGDKENFVFMHENGGLDLDDFDI